MKRAALGLSLIVSVIAVLTLALASPARAHAELESTSPADGAVLDALPATVSLVFGEDLLPASVNVSVSDSAGTVVTIVGPTVDGGTVTFPWPGWPGTPPGDAWTVNYRVVSQDGHPVTGSFGFTAPPAAGTGSPAAIPASSAPASPAPAASAVATAEATAPAATTDSGSSGPSPLLLIGAGLAAGIGIGLVIAVRRRSGSGSASS